MITYTTFGELREKAPLEIWDYFYRMECKEPQVDERLLMDWYGGDAHLIEDMSELANVNTTSVKEEGPISNWKWYNLLEKPDAFDCCRWICEGKYVEIFTATTDAGGPTYFVPKEIADKCPNLLKSIELSNEVWSGDITIP